VVDGFVLASKLRRTSRFTARKSLGRLIATHGTTLEVADLSVTGPIMRLAELSKSKQTGATMAIRLLIADDHELVREGLRSAFEHTEIEVVAEASNGEDAIRLALSGLVNMLLLDLRMPDRDGFEVLNELKLQGSELAVVIYSHVDRADFRTRARQLGANGYVVKTAHKNDLISTILSAFSGEDLWRLDGNDEI